MSTSILYIPREMDPHGVLADGLCGAKVPTAIEIESNDGRISWKEGPISWWGLDNTVALPLVWRGEVVPEAIDRLTTRLADHRWPRVGPSKMGGGASFLPCFDLANRPYRWWLRSRWMDEAADIEQAVPNTIADDLAPAWALATIAARELGGRVEVVGG